MKKREDILDSAYRDVTNTNYRDVAHLWLEVRKIEVLLDIRDTFESMFIEIENLAQIIKAR